MPLGRKDNEHLVAFHTRPRFDLADIRQIFFEPFENPRAEFPVRHLAPAKPDRRFDFVAVVEPLARVLHAIVVIVIVRARTKLDLFDGDDDLFFLRLVRLLLGFVLKLAEVDNATDGRVGGGRDFNQVQALLARLANGVARFHHAELFAVLTDDAHFGHANSFIDARHGSAPIVGAMTTTSKTCSYCCTSIVRVQSLRFKAQGSYDFKP